MNNEGFGLVFSLCDFVKPNAFLTTFTHEWIWTITLQLCSQKKLFFITWK